MNRSETIANLAKALAVAQGQMGPAHKDTPNPYFKSVYADLSSVVSAIRGPLSSNGLSFVQVTIPSENEEICVETVLMHESGEWLSAIIAIPVSKADAQGYGSALTYAKRYGLQGLLGVPSDDDDGNAAAKAKPAPKAAIQGTITTFASHIAEHGEEEGTFLKEIAACLVEYVEGNSNPVGAYDYLTEQHLDNEQKLALNDLLKPNSKTRNMLKKEGEARRAVANAEKLAGAV